MHVPLSLLLLCATLGFGQSKEALFYELNVQGIPFNKRVNTVYEDSFGYLWIGTNTGLYQYDGYELKAFQNNVFDPYSLPNNSVNSIVEDDYSNLWIGSESYLIHYHRKKNQFKGFYKNVTSVVLAKTSDGNIWANPRNTGLVLITPSEHSDDIDLDSHFNYENAENLSRFNRQVNAFAEDEFGRYWIGTNSGIFLLNSDNAYLETNFTQEVIGLTRFKNNLLLAVTPRDLFVLEINKSSNAISILESYKNIASALNPSAEHTTLAVSDSNDEIWIGTTKGLIEGKRSNHTYTFDYYAQNPSKNSLISNQINALTFDDYDNLWIGSVKGINKHISRTSLFDFFQLKNPQSQNRNPNIQAILKDDAQRFLMAGTSGLYTYNAKVNELKTLNILADSIGSNISSLSKNFTSSEILLSVNNQLFQTKAYNTQSTNVDLELLKRCERRITDIVPVSKNEIWVGLWNAGLDVISTDSTKTKFQQKAMAALSQSHTSAMHLSSDQELWVGTRGEGLFKIDLVDETIQEFKPEKFGLSSKAILCIFEDPEQRLWVGTRGGGLNLYEKERNSFRNFIDARGAVPKTVASIQMDAKNYLWMSTEEGITRFNPRAENFRSFGMEDGIDEVNFTFNSSASNKVEGALYFGSSNGFYTVHPNEFSQKNHPPSTVITNFSILKSSKTLNTDHQINFEPNGSQNSEVGIDLAFDQNNILINFSSLDLTAPNKNEFAYKLEGLNDYWVYTNATNRNANYNNLAPGSYTFKIKSSNSDGIWNETPTEVSFSIAPPFWKSIWAIIAYVLLAGILAYIGYLLVKRWYRLKKNLVEESISRKKDNEHNRMKMIFFTDISHELRTPLSLILGTIEKVVKEKKFSLNPQTAQRIYNNTLRMRRLINQIMDVRKFDEQKYKLSISKNDLVQDIRIIKNAFNDFARIYAIDYKFVCNEEKIWGWYDVDILEKTLFNLLSNAFKYTSEGGEVTVLLEKVTEQDENAANFNITKGRYIKCTVRDNGMGIPKKDLKYIFDRYYQATKAHKNQIPGTGIGMELVHKLIERHYGVISVKSEENVLTEFTFYLPVHKKKYSKKERLKFRTPLKKNFIENSEFQVIEEVSTEFELKQQSGSRYKPKVLLVEDHQELRTMLKEELTPDFHILEASNGQEGYECMLNESPQLVISDILMPVEDGISMLRRMKKHPELNNIPIFMLTAKNSDESKIKCLSLGADDYIGKPFSMEFVKWKVKNTLISREELKEKYSKVISPQPSEIEVESNDEKFVKKLIQIIENNLDDNLLSVEFLASEVGMSRANLYRKVQAIVKDTPVNFIKKIKLKRAAQLLSKNTLYISEIAFMTGFNSQKYFGKCFQKEYGMSPTEYVKKYALEESVEG